MSETKPTTTAPAADAAPAKASTVPPAPRALTPEQTKEYEKLVRAGVPIYDACAQARGLGPAAKE